MHLQAVVYGPPHKFGALPLLNKRKHEIIMIAKVNKEIRN